MEILDLSLAGVRAPLPSFIYKDISSFVEQSNFYHSQPKKLIEAISNKYDISPEWIYITAGNDDAIKILAARCGKCAYAFTPTYVCYNDVQRFGGTLKTLPMVERNGTWTVPLQSFENASLIFIANPNNPFGITSREEILKLCSLNPQSLVVVDEAYALYEDVSVLQEVKHLPNLMVLRSFSKDYGMAGARVGFCVADPKHLRLFHELDSQWANVSYLAVGAALSAFNHEDYFKEMREEVLSVKKWFEDELRSAGAVVCDSRIIVTVIDCGSEEKATEFRAKLLEDGIKVNATNEYSNLGLGDRFVRIGIGRQVDMEKMLQVMCVP